MARSLAWLGNLKLSQLRHLANSLGTNSSGTKPALTSALTSRLTTGIFPQSSKPGRRSHAPRTESGGVPRNLISIDMGIRNLAYCRLIPPASSSSSSGRPSSDGKVQLAEWRRLDVTAQEAQTHDSDGPATVGGGGGGGKDAYHPATYASAACSILAPLVQAHPSAHVVIERQRFRSMGGKGVLEWTLRVNLFEAMLYAVLESMKRLGKWEGEVHDVRPGHVSLFWLGGEEEGKGRRGTGGKVSASRRKSEKKRETIELVRRWVREGDRLDVKGQAGDTAQRFMQERRVRGEEKENGKLDDLADCVAQGMAVLKWEENRRMLLEFGEEATSRL